MNSDCVWHCGTSPEEIKMANKNTFKHNFASLSSTRLLRDGMTSGGEHAGPHLLMRELIS
jgi:hypothetical protein